MEQNFGQISTALEKTRSEKAKRLEDAAKLIPFEVPFLDDCLCGIGGEELILIGGRSGHGKTELAATIAFSIAKANRKVCFVALEAGEFEIERRNKFKILAHHFYKNRESNKIKQVPNYMEWKNGRQEELLSPFEKYAEEDYLGNIYTRYREREYTIEHLRKDMTSMKGLVDVMVVDHLHYFDFESTNENKALGDIVKQIRDLAFDFKKPVILVGHIRKKDRKFSPIVPDMEEFHGTSDIYKNATKIITIAPYNPDQADGIKLPAEAKYMRRTLMRACKVRDDGSRASYLGLTTFDIRTNTYGKYEIGTLSEDGQKFNLCSLDQIPDFAKNALRLEQVPVQKPEQQTSYGKLIPNVAPKFNQFRDD